MKVTELRIGNYVNINDVTLYKVDMLYDDYVNLKYWKPIPLTEEWLVKFGFEINDCDNYELAYMVEINSTFTIIKEERGYFYIDSRNNEIKHVHQLQNLYWCLTQKELHYHYTHMQNFQFLILLLS